MPESRKPVASAFQRLLPAVAPALLLGLNIFIFGTFLVFNENRGEFLVPYTDALYRYYLPGLAITLMIGLLPFAISKRVGRHFNTIITLVGIMTYIHGNLLLWDTGILDGSQLDLSARWRSAVDAVLWITLAGLAIRHRHWLAVQGWKICIVLILFQIAGVISVYDSKIESPSTARFSFPNGLANFSRKTNVIQIILDGFQASIFEQILGENPELQDSFQGFTFFRDTTTPSDVTYLSVPATLTGKAFKNEQPISRYLETTLQGDNLYSFLAERGFDVDVATPLWWNPSRPFFASYFRIPTPYTNEQEALFSTALLLFDISLYRATPHFLKALVYRSGAWLFSGKLVADPAQQFEHFSHTAFITDLQDGMTVTSNRPRYKFIQLVTPHPPLVSTQDCGYTGAALEYSKEAFLQQSTCALKTVAVFLDQLKSSGVYDNSLLVIHGDHGGGVSFELALENGEKVKSADVLSRVWGNPIPLMLIKPLNATGNIQISDKQVQLLDVPVTIAEQLGFASTFPGRSMFEKDDGVGVERFYYHSVMHRNEAATRDSFDEMTTHKISGSVYELTSWKDLGSYTATVIDSTDSYLWGTKISFGKRGNSRPFQVSGWVLTTAERILWTEGNEASLAIRFPKTTNPVILRAVIKPMLAPGKLDRQRVIIYMGSEKVGSWNVSANKFQTMELVLPPGLFNRTEKTVIRFELPDAKSPKSLGVGKDTRDLAIAFYSIEFKQADDMQLQAGQGE